MRFRYDHEAWRPFDFSQGNTDWCISQAFELWTQTRTNPAYRERAVKMALNCLQLKCDERQQLRIYELLGIIFGEMNDEHEALRWIDEALELALANHNLVAVRRLIRRRAVLHQLILKMREASEDLEDGLATLQYEDATPVHGDMVFALESAAQLAALYLFQADYTRTKVWLHRTENLVRHTTTQRIEEAVASSLWAHLHRWEEHPVIALHPAKCAAEQFEYHRRYDSAGRTHLLVAEIALDLAELHSEGTTRIADLELASERVKQADRIAHDIGDAGLADLVTLTKARLNAVLGFHVGQVKQVEEILRRTTSPLLAAQAWTTLGRLFGSDRYTESALNAFRHVDHALRGSDMKAQGVWAQRALFRYDQGAKQWWR